MVPVREDPRCVAVHKDHRQSRRLVQGHRELLIVVVGGEAVLKDVPLKDIPLEQVLQGTENRLGSDVERRESENGLPQNRPLALAARAPSLTATQSMRDCDACSQPAPAGTIKPALMLPKSCT